MTTRTGCGLGALVLGIVAAASAPLLSQRALPDAPGTWKAWKPFSASAAARKERGATPALLKAFEGELLALNAILRGAPRVASPVGFSVETWGHLAGFQNAAHAPGQPPGAKLPLAGGLTFGAFRIFEYERAGKMVRQDTGETELQQFFVNEIGRGLIDVGNVPDWGAVDHDAFLQPMPAGEIAGLPLYGDGLVIARDPKSLWTPLTQRAALTIVKMARDTTLSEARESAEKMKARLAVVRDPAKRAQRLKEAQQAAASMPNPKAFVAQIEESIRVEEAMLMQELSPTGSTGKSLADAEKSMAEVTSWVAELSPAQLDAPSCYAAAGTTLRTRFPPGLPRGCHPLVRPNYAYFNPALPRSAPQVLIITPIKRCFDTADKYNREANSASPAGCRANRALVESMDKDAIRAWLR